VRTEALENLRHYIDSFWAGALTSFKSVAEQEGLEGGGNGAGR
jgi:hypothetical protein